MSLPEGEQVVAQRAKQIAKAKGRKIRIKRE